MVIFDNNGFLEEEYTLKEWLSTHLEDMEGELRITVGYFSLDEVTAIISQVPSNVTVRILAKAEIATTDVTLMELLQDNGAQLEDHAEYKEVYEALGESLFVRIHRQVHAKLYLTPEAAVLGSSNLTQGGLANNIELNVSWTNTDRVAQLSNWFDAVWQKSTDFSHVLAAILELSPVGHQLVDLPVQDRNVLRRAYGIENPNILEGVTARSLLGQLAQLEEIIDPAVNPEQEDGATRYYNDLIQKAAKSRTDKPGFEAFRSQCPSNAREIWKRYQQRESSSPVCVAPINDLFLLDLYANDDTPEEVLDLQDESQNIPTVMVQLWQNQQEALDTWIDAGRDGLIEMATATGKTVVGLAAISELCGPYYGEPRTETADILVVVHRTALREQWLQEILEKLGLDSDPFSEDGSPVIEFDTGRIEIQTPQYISLNQDEFTEQSYDLVIYDEVHHYSQTDGWGATLDYLSRDATLGLTATLEEPRRQLLEKRINDIVYEYGFKKAQADHLLPELEWYLHPIELTEEEQAEFERWSRKLPLALEEVKQDEATYNNQLELIEADDIPYSREVLVEEETLDLAHFLQLFKLTNIVQDEENIPETWTKPIRILRQRREPIYSSQDAQSKAITLTKSYVECGNKVIVFSMRVETANSIAAKVPNSFVVHGHLSNEKSMDQIANFRARDSGALVAPMLLDEGIDVPDADVGINVAGTKSRLQLIQRMGRILRPGGKILPVFHHFAHPSEIDLYYSLGPIEPTVMKSVTPQITKRLPRRIGPIQFSHTLSMISQDQAQQLLKSENITEELRAYSDNRWWLSFLAQDYPDEFESWLHKRANNHSLAETEIQTVESPLGSDAE